MNEDIGVRMRAMEIAAQLATGNYVPAAEVADNAEVFRKFMTGETTSQPAVDTRRSYRISTAHQLGDLVDYQPIVGGPMRLSVLVVAITVSADRQPEYKIRLDDGSVVVASDDELTGEIPF